MHDSSAVAVLLLLRENNIDVDIVIRYLMHRLNDNFDIFYDDNGWCF